MSIKTLNINKIPFIHIQSSGPAHTRPLSYVDLRPETTISSCLFYAGVLIMSNAQSGFIICKITLTFKDHPKPVACGPFPSFYSSRFYNAILRV